VSEMANIAGEVQENSEVLNLRVSPTLVAVEPGPERLGSRNPTIFFLFVDLSLVLVSAYLATYSRWWLATANGNSLSEISNGRHLSFAVLYAGLVILSCLAYHVYSTNELRAARQEQLALLKAVGTAIHIPFGYKDHLSGCCRGNGGFQHDRNDGLAVLAVEKSSRWTGLPKCVDRGSGGCRARSRKAFFAKPPAGIRGEGLPGSQGRQHARSLSGTPEPPQRPQNAWKRARLGARRTQ
jgi:hypothetical protein